MRDYPYKRTYATLRCRRCRIEVDTYSSVVASWCVACGVPMAIVGEKSWTVTTDADRTSTGERQ